MLCYRKCFLFLQTEKALGDGAGATKKKELKKKQERI